MRIFILFVVTLISVSSCNKQEFKPECMTHIENKLIDFFDSGRFHESTTQIKIDAYIFQNEKVFVLPVTTLNWSSPPIYLIDNNCDTLGIIGQFSELSLNFNQNSEFVETVWTYPN